jgi:hypothetical protein
MRGLTEVRKGFAGDACSRRVHAMLWSKELQRRSDRFKTLLKILLPRLTHETVRVQQCQKDHGSQHLTAVQVSETPD